MKKQLLVFMLLISTLGSSIVAQEKAAPTPSWAKETDAAKAKRMQWWQHDRFGMFIHWGIYALPARHEWVKRNEGISDEKYQEYFDRFNPDLYNPTEWAAKAKDAGMKYVVLTTKHHDGFCLWDSKHTDYKVTNTPYGKDLLKDFVDAFRAEGIRIGFYYSLIDWIHPDFPYDNLHPLGPRDPEERKEANKKRDLKKYQKYMKDQMTELLTDFGDIDVLFMDFSYPGENGKGHEEWDSEGLLKLVRKLQPQTIVNNRLGLEHTDWGWDFVTPEQYTPNSTPTVRGKEVAWEACQTFSGSWGYHRDETSWKSSRQLITMLIETVSKGGNLLLNVGPTARGEFDYRANERLDDMAHWMRYNSRSIYGAEKAPKEFEVPQNCFLTYNKEKNRLYVHILEWPFKSLHMPNYKGKIKYVQLLNDDSELKFFTRPGKDVGSHTVETSGENDVIINLPVHKPNIEVPVIEIFLED